MECPGHVMWPRRLKFAWGVPEVLRGSPSVSMYSYCHQATTQACRQACQTSLGVPQNRDPSAKTGFELHESKVPLDRRRE